MTSLKVDIVHSDSRFWEKIIKVVSPFLLSIHSVLVFQSQRFVFFVRQLMAVFVWPTVVWFSSWGFRQFGIFIVHHWRLLSSVSIYVLVLSGVLRRKVLITLFFPRSNDSRVGIVNWISRQLTFDHIGTVIYTFWFVRIVIDVTRRLRSVKRGRHHVKFIPVYCFTRGEIVVLLLVPRRGIGIWTKRPARRIRRLTTRVRSM